MSVKVLLQEVRKSKGLSQNELARLIKMSPQNIQKIEQGEAKSLTFKTLSKFCRVLECQPGDLLIYEDELATSVQNKSNLDRESSVKKTSSKKSTEQPDYFGLEASSLFPRVVAQTV